MEWARDTAKTATNAAMGNTDTAGEAYDTTKDTAAGAYESAGDYMPDVTSGKTTSAALLNSAPFRSFKPDPSIVWQGHLIYVLLAAGCTLPWWAFLCAVDYFQFLYPGLHIIRLFVFAYYGPWMVVYLLIAAFWREGTSWIKINVGLSISVAVLALIALLHGVFIDNKGTTATFWVTLVAVALAGGGDAISQGSLLGIAAELPVSFAKAYCDGATVSGVFVLIVRGITKASLSSSEKALRIGGIVYFAVGALFLVLVLALFAYVHNMPEMSSYSSLGLGNFETVRLLVQDEESVTIEVAAGAAIAAVAAGSASPPHQLAWRPVLDHIKMPAIAMFITSCVTLSIFPGVLAEDLRRWSVLGDYSPLLLLGTFIICDLIGRLVTASDVTDDTTTVMNHSLARLVLVGLFILALFFDTSVILMAVLTALLGLTHGYQIATLTVLIPRSTPAALAETAGILTALVMNLGVLVGAGLSWIWLLF